MAVRRGWFFIRADLLAPQVTVAFDAAEDLTVAAV